MLNKIASRQVWTSPQKETVQSRQSVLVLCHPQSKDFFPHTQRELPVFPFGPNGSCAVAGHHWQVSGPILLAPSLKTFVLINTNINLFSSVRYPLLFLQAKQSQTPQSFLIREMIYSLIIFIALHWTVSSSSLYFLNGEVQNWTQ